MTAFTNILAAALFVAVSLLSGSANAQCQAGGRCDACGACCNCRTVCVLECKEKEIEVIRWKCEPEDFCLPGPCKTRYKICQAHGLGGCSGHGSHQECGACPNGSYGLPLAIFGDHCFPRPVTYQEECPGCPTCHHKQKLYKKVEKIKVPTYVWKVQHCCEGCDAAGAMPGAVAPEGAAIPLPPVADAKLKYRLPERRATK